MALIKCPECGESISSIAEKCVHCGCALAVCPDCGASYAGETEICSLCGFNFKKSNERKTGKAFKGILDYWGAFNPGDRLLSRLIPIILAVIGVGFIAFMIMSVTNVLRLGYNKDNTKIFQIGVSVNVAVIFAVVFFVLLIAANILHSAFIPYKCGAWIREGEIDVTEFTAQLKELPKSKRTAKNNREIRSAYVSEYPRELSKTVKISSVCGIFYIVCFIIACVFLNEGIDAFIVNKSFISPETTLISSVDWLLLLIPGIIITLTLSIDVLFRVLFRRKVGGWLGYPTVAPENQVKEEIRIEPEKKPGVEIKEEIEVVEETEKEDGLKEEVEEDFKEEIKQETKEETEEETEEEFAEQTKEEDNEDLVTDITPETED